MTISLLLSLTALAASIFALAFQVWLIWENEGGTYSPQETQEWDWPAEYINLHGVTAIPENLTLSSVGGYINLHGVTAEVKAKAMEEYLSERVGELK